MEFIRFIFCICGMITEILCTAQEVFRLIACCGSPCDIEVVVEISQFDDIPGMSAAVADSGDHAAVHTKRAHQTVEQDGIALTYAYTAYDCPISCMIDILRIGLIIHCIGNIVCHPVIDCFDFFIITGTIQSQFRKKCRYGGIHFFLLGSIGIVCDRKGDTYIGNGAVTVS